LQAVLPQLPRRFLDVPKTVIGKPEIPAQFDHQTGTARRARLLATGRPAAPRARR